MSTSTSLLFYGNMAAVKRTRKTPTPYYTDDQYYALLEVLIGSAEPVIENDGKPSDFTRDVVRNGELGTIAHCVLGGSVPVDLFLSHSRMAAFVR